jgi:hypothetical protein
MAYVYRGKVRDTEDPTPIDFDDSACGTYKGYRRHKRKNVAACDPCMEAAADYAREYARQKSGKAPEDRRIARRGPDAGDRSCGTLGGYAEHRRTKTKACGPCRAAHNTYRKAWRLSSGVTRSVIISADATCKNCGHHLVEVA